MSKRNNDTKNDMEIVSTRKEYDTSLDNLLTTTALEKTMGDVALGRERSHNARGFLVDCMFFNAVIEKDVDLIKTLATRIDGTVPEEDKRDGFANILGDALEDVLSYEQPQLLSVSSEDSPIIAMAKVLVYVAACPVGNNVQARKSRNLAAQMILERTGGRKTSPTKHQLETVYVQPLWMGTGEQEDQNVDQEGHKDAR